jgi:nitronate monooxygenase
VTAIMVSTVGCKFWGDPSLYVVAAHTAGSLVMHTVGSALEARRVREAGVDILVAQGWEAGGHVCGQVATLPLVPCVVDAVATAPVVTAGGIADGRGLAAVLALGAAGAWMGTRFLASQEANAHPLYKEKVLQAAETATTYSCLFDDDWPDAPHRTLHNSTLTNWEANGSPPEKIVEQCQAAGLVWGKELYFDGTKVAANAGKDSLKPRFYVDAHLDSLFDEARE